MTLKSWAFSARITATPAGPPAPVTMTVRPCPSSPARAPRAAGWAAGWNQWAEVRDCNVMDESTDGAPDPFRPAPPVPPDPGRL